MQLGIETSTSSHTGSPLPREEISPHNISRTLPMTKSHQIRISSPKMISTTWVFPLGIPTQLETATPMTPHLYSSPNLFWPTHPIKTHLWAGTRPFHATALTGALQLFRQPKETSQKPTSPPLIPRYLVSIRIGSTKILVLTWMVGYQSIEGGKNMGKYWFYSGTTLKLTIQKVSKTVSLNSCIGSRRRTRSEVECGMRNFSDGYFATRSTCYWCKTHLRMNCRTNCTGEKKRFWRACRWFPSCGYELSNQGTRAPEHGAMSSEIFQPSLVQKIFAKLYVLYVNVRWAEFYYPMIPLQINSEHLKKISPHFSQENICTIKYRQRLRWKRTLKRLCSFILMSRRMWSNRLHGKFRRVWAQEARTPIHYRGGF